MRPLLPLLLACAGCAPKVFPEDSLPRHQERPVYGDFPASYDVVWDAVVEVLGEAASLEDISKEEGRIVTEWIRGFSDYIYKTYGGTRIPEPIRYRLVVDVTPQGERTEVKMVNQEQVEKDLISVDMEFTGAIYRWIDVPSSTAKELALMEKIQATIENSRGQDYDYRY